MIPGGLILRFLLEMREIWGFPPFVPGQGLAPKHRRIVAVLTLLCQHIGTNTRLNFESELEPKR